MKIKVIFHKKIDNEKFIESSKVFMQKVMFEEKKEGDEFMSNIKLYPHQQIELDETKNLNKVAYYHD